MKRKAVLLVAMCLLAIESHTQPAVAEKKPLYYQFDIPVGMLAGAEGGMHAGAVLRLVHGTDVFCLGYLWFNYMPENLPSDYDPGLILSSISMEKYMNSHSLLMVGYGRYLTPFDNPVRMLVGLDALIGTYREAGEFTRVQYENWFQWVFSPLGPNYTHTCLNGFAGGGQPYVKIEIASRRISAGVTLGALVTNRMAAMTLGLSAGFGKLRPHRPDPTPNTY